MMEHPQWPTWKGGGVSVKHTPWNCQKCQGKERRKSKEREKKARGKRRDTYLYHWYRQRKMTEVAPIVAYSISVCIMCLLNMLKYLYNTINLTGHYLRESMFFFFCFCFFNWGTGGVGIITTVNLYFLQVEK